MPSVNKMMMDAKISVEVFFNQNYVITGYKYDRVITDVIFEEYKTFCEERSLEVANRQYLGKFLMGKGIKKSARLVVRVGNDSCRKHAYVGLKRLTEIASQNIAEDEKKDHQKEIVEHCNQHTDAMDKRSTNSVILPSLKQENYSIKRKAPSDKDDLDIKPQNKIRKIHTGSKKSSKPDKQEEGMNSFLSANYAVTFDPGDRVLTTEFYKDYRDYCSRNHLFSGSSVFMCRHLTKLGIQAGGSVGRGQNLAYFGLRRNVDPLHLTTDDPTLPFMEYIQQHLNPLPPLPPDNDQLGGYRPFLNNFEGNFVSWVQSLPGAR